MVNQLLSNCQAAAGQLAEAIDGNNSNCQGNCPKQVPKQFPGNII
jgi:hypothetical protein